MLRIRNQQMAGVRPGSGIFVLLRRRMGQGQVFCIKTLLFQNPAQHAHDQGQVSAGQNRLPAVATTRGQAGRRWQDRGNNHVLEGVFQDVNGLLPAHGLDAGRDYRIEPVLHQ